MASITFSTSLTFLSMICTWPKCMFLSRVRPQCQKSTKTTSASSMQSQSLLSKLPHPCQADGKFSSRQTTQDTCNLLNMCWKPLKGWISTFSKRLSIRSWPELTFCFISLTPSGTKSSMPKFTDRFMGLAWLLRLGAICHAMLLLKSNQKRLTGTHKTALFLWPVDFRQFYRKITMIRLSLQYSKQSRRYCPYFKIQSSSRSKDNL